MKPDQIKFLKALSKVLWSMFALYVLLFHFWDLIKILGIISLLAIIVSLGYIYVYSKIKDFF
jgi:hypothetical protein